MNSLDRKTARYLRRKAKREAKKFEKFKDCFDFDKVFSYEHLYTSGIECGKGVKWKSSVQSYLIDLPLNTARTRKALLNGSYKAKKFHCFSINERGKVREIKSVHITDRVVQRCLCDYCLTPVLSNRFICDNGACLPEKGYTFAVKRTTKFLTEYIRKNGANGYVIKFDFKKYFESIPHDLIFGILDKAIPDERIKALTKQLVKMNGERGLGLGSQISQIFALAAADRIDHYIKEVLRVKHYVRYMDDGVLIVPTKEEAKAILEKIIVLSESMGLHLNAKKTQIIKLTRGFTFLQVRFYVCKNGKIIKKINRPTVTRMRRKLKAYSKMLEKGVIVFSDIRQSWASWCGYARHFNAYRTIQSMSRLHNLLFITYWRDKYALHNIIQGQCN